MLGCWTTTRLCLAFAVAAALALVMVMFEVDTTGLLHVTDVTKCCTTPHFASLKMFKSWRKGVVTTDTPEVPVNCSKLIAGDEEEIQRVSNITATWKSAVSDEAMLERVRDCSWLREYFNGTDLYNSELEKSFPIAFTFVVYDSPQQVLRLLRLLYRPQNAYCIHYDAKTTSPIKEYAEAIAGCLDNVIVPSKLERVIWGHYSILGAQMNCMTDLLQYRVHSSNQHKWKYIINLCGKELPLVTHREIVDRLIQLNGSSSVITRHMTNQTEEMNRIKYQVRLNDEQTNIYTDRQTSLGEPPFDIHHYYKSLTYLALSYQFANYLTTNSTAIEIHNFFKNCKNPEEHFYATIFMMPGVPGGYRREIRHLYFRVANAFWATSEDAQCHGRIVNKICIVDAGDLAAVLRFSRRPGRNALFQNKYFMEYDRTVMRCMEERIVQRNKLEYQQDHKASTGYNYLCD